MRLPLISLKACQILLLTLTAFLVILLSLLSPIPNPEEYHLFADQRSWFNIPNTLNVISNGIFTYAGVWGLLVVFAPSQTQFFDRRERWPWAGVFIGLILTSIGSGYYHLAPDNATLFWDRLPMSTVFTSLIAALIAERININLGLWLWPILLVLGFWSVFTWYHSELSGNSDLRFYLGIQLSAIVVLTIMLISPSPYTLSSELAIVLLCYALAFAFESSDHFIFKATGGIISGHTLKHLSAGIAGITLVHMIGNRKLEDTL